MVERKIVRCAIYTRKSSDEGLEQGFNSLDAQREACGAYVTSQKHEGWIELRERYDDGGFSGGNMDRPGLQQLLSDIQAKRVDVIVVYKVDRLTRSLADFAKIVEVLDDQGVSFVAVTQQFNTTTSMGRLTLNVLLSFAQFEREIAGERIRDKIAASKAKGMWMGGNVPLGYEVQDRSLVINAIEAKKVRLIFQRYLELRSVHLLADELRARGIKSARRTTLDGKLIGGHPISRGNLYGMLRSPIYIGQVVHRGKAFPGLHQPIVGQDIWDQVQNFLNANRVTDRRKVRARVPSPLSGVVFDSTGERLSPTHSSKNGVRYRYYVSSSSVRGRPRKDEVGMRWRIPALELEQTIVGSLRSLLEDESGLSALIGLERMTPAEAKAALDAAVTFGEALNVEDPAKLREQMEQVLQRVEVGETSIEITVGIGSLRKVLGLQNTGDLGRESHKIVVPVQITKRGVEQKLIVGADFVAPHIPDEALLTAIARAHSWVQEIASGRVADLNAVAKSECLPASYVRSHLPLAFLAPSIVMTVLEGRQPADLTLKHLMYRTQLPIDWSLQRRQLGFDR